MMMRLNDHGGLACTGTTWALVALIVLAWLGAPAVALIRRRGWRAMPTSLLGFVWLGFGFDFVVRFALLAMDSVEFGNDTFRLADLATSTVDHALRLALVYWGLLRPRLRRVGRAAIPWCPRGRRGVRRARAARPALCRARRFDGVLAAFLRAGAAAAHHADPTRHRRDAVGDSGCAGVGGVSGLRS